MGVGIEIDCSMQYDASLYAQGVFLVGFSFEGVVKKIAQGKFFILA